MAGRRRRPGSRLGAMVFAAALLMPVSGTPAAEPVPPPAELEAMGAVIGRIQVVPGDVFDPSIEGENGWLYRAANTLHIETRPPVIRKQLLFESGDVYAGEPSAISLYHRNESSIVPLTLEHQSLSAFSAVVHDPLRAARTIP